MQEDGRHVEYGATVRRPTPAAVSDGATGLPLGPRAGDQDAGAVAATTAGRVEVRRSERRRRTVSAYRKDGTTIVLLPARMSRSDERRWIATMVKRLDAQDRRRKPSDTALFNRARELSALHLDGRARPTSVQWVSNQGARWGSCTPSSGTVRLSHRLRGMPRWVVDYVLVHELAHLLVADHSAEFWSLVSSYPLAERARGFLEGVAAAAGLELAADLGTPCDPSAATEPAGLW